MLKKNMGLRLDSAKATASSLLASVICILIGLFIGFIVLFVLGWVTVSQKGGNANFSEMLRITWEQGFKRMLEGGFYKNANIISGMGLRSELLQIAPLIMTGLSVAFAFKTGLFNIGAAGQYTVGAFMALYTSIVLKQPWYVCLLAATLGGAIWGAIPGFFKAYLNVNEVITAIMFNWIGLYGVNTLIYQGGTGPMYNINTTKTYVIQQVSPQSLLPTFNVPVNGKDYFNRMYLPTISIFIAIGVAILIWVILSKTVFGYELKACGLNKHAAKYAGINDKRNIILSMTIAGALAGLGAGLFYLSGSKEWEPLNSTALPATGFNGISVALLASSNPIGSIFSATFIAHITEGGSYMEASIFPKEVASIISGVVIYLCAFSLLFRGAVAKLLTKKKNVASETPAVAEPDQPEDSGKEDEA